MGKGNQKGFSLVGTVMSMAIGLIIMSALSSFMYQQQRELARLSLKSNLIDVQNAVRRALSDPTKCIANFSNVKIDASSLPGSVNGFRFPLNPAITGVNNISKIFDSTSNNSSAPTIIQEGSLEMNKSSTVEDIFIKNWRSLNNSNFLADLVISFRSDLGPMAPVIINDISFTTGGGNNSQESVTGCSAGGAGAPPTGGAGTAGNGSSGGSTISFGGLYTVNGPTVGGCGTPNPQTGGCSCPSGYSSKMLGHFCASVANIPGYGCYLHYCYKVESHKN